MHKRDLGPPVEVSKVGEDSDEYAPVTVIGLGAMGSALAEAFLHRGLPTTFWNRSANKANPLIDHGAVRAATVADAVAASKLIIVCVLDYHVVNEILDSLGDIVTKRTLVNFTNGTPAQARQMATRTAKLGADYLGGGIMAVPEFITQLEAMMLYSGSQKAFASYQQELSILGTSTYLGPDAGLASIYDLALLSGMYGMFAGFLHAVALVGTEKVSATEFMSLLAPWLNGMIASLLDLAKQVDTGDYTKDVASNLGMQAVAYANIVETSKAQEISVDLLEPMQTLIDRRIADGHGADDISSLIELIRKS